MVFSGSKVKASDSEPASWEWEAFVCLFSIKSEDLRKKRGRRWWYCPNDYLWAGHQSMSMLQPGVAQSGLCGHSSYQSMGIDFSHPLPFESSSSCPSSACFSWHACFPLSHFHMSTSTGKSFRFHKTPIFHFSLNFSYKFSLATIPTNLSHLGLVSQIQAVTSAFLQTFFFLLLPHSWFPNQL